MNRDELEALLDGHAAGILTPAEKQRLFAAALEDQALFDALVDEEALREVLMDPVHRAEFLAALADAPARPVRPLWRRPTFLAAATLLAGVAGTLLIRPRTVALPTAPAPPPSEAPAQAAPHPLQTPQAPALRDQEAPAKRAREAPARQEGGKGSLPEVTLEKAAADAAPAAGIVSAAAPAPPPPADKMKEADVRMEKLESRTAFKATANLAPGVAAPRPFQLEPHPEGGWLVHVPTATGRTQTGLTPTGLTPLLLVRQGDRVRRVLPLPGRGPTLVFRLNLAPGERAELHMVERIPDDLRQVPPGGWPLVP